MFSVHVPQVVIVRAPSIVLFRNVAAILIFLGVIVVGVIRNNGYLTFGDIQGEARFTVGLGQQAEYSWLPPEDTSYCCTVNCSQPACANAFRRPCLYGDNRNMWSQTEQSILIFSNAERSLQRANWSCMPDPFDDFGYGQGCDAWMPPGDRKCFFFADVEKVFLKIKTQVTQANVRFNATSHTVNAKLEIEGKHALQHQLCRLGGSRPMSPCSIPLAKHPPGDDIVPISLLLRAVGRSWNFVSPAHGQSIRERGVTLELEIVYANYRRWLGIQPISIVYRVRRIKDDARYEHETLRRAPLTRTLGQYDGIRVRFIVGGRAAKIDVLPLSLRLVTFVTFLGLVNKATKHFAFRIHKAGNYIKEFAQEQFPDDVDLQAIAGLTPQEAERALSVYNLPRGGTMEQRVHRLLLDGWRPLQSMELPAAAAAGAAKDTEGRT
mmetsp:Transcript_96889/g.274413  ORF Transcript_96889/g.274413 Transcript_96889/m.274413 type:complete len:436 (+) Transcript_96889:75-1382(+)